MRRRDASAPLIARDILVGAFACLLACGSEGGAVGSSVDAAPTPPGEAEPGPTSSSDASTTADTGAPDATDASAPKVEVDIDAIPWKTGASVGFGVAMKDTENPRGENSFIAYAGFGVSLPSARAWTTALYRASLRDRGVRYVWAVQGPNEPQYANQEIGNSKVVETLLPVVTTSTKFVLVAGHSSGSFVAHELLGQLAGGLDPHGISDHRVVYFDLDGGESGLTPSIVGRLKHAYFAASRDTLTGTYSPNASTMQALGATYASAGGYFENNADGSGCNAGATWCVHVTLVTTKPHDPANADAALDYSDFAGRPVSHAYLDAKASAAGLVP